MTGGRPPHTNTLHAHKHRDTGGLDNPNPAQISDRERHADSVIAGVALHSCGIACARDRLIGEASA